MMNGIDAYTAITWMHLLSGSLALSLFWLAAAMRKGTPRHRRIGQIYLGAMLGVIVSGIPLAIAVGQRGNPVAAIFLGYLVLLVSSACWSAWRAIRDRHDPGAYFGRSWAVLTAAVGLCGAGMIMLGAQVGSVLLMVFGGIGIAGTIGALRARRRAPQDPRWWLKEHYGAMIGNGVATHIAFLGIGVRGLVPGIDPQALQAIAWFGPLVVAVVAGIWLDRRYGRAPQRRAPHGALGAGHAGG